jgi:hypothetical protein
MDHIIVKHLSNLRHLYESYAHSETDTEKSKFYKGMSQGIEVALVVIDCVVVADKSSSRQFEDFMNRIRAEE